MDSSDTRRSTHGGSKRALAALAVLVAVCLGLAGGGVVWFVIQSIQDNLASRTAQDFVFEHPVVQAELGPPVRLAGFVLGKIVEGDGFGSARLTFWMNGSRSSGRATVTLQRDESKWHVETVAYTGTDGVTRNLEVKKPPEPPPAQEPRHKDQEPAPSTVMHARELYKSGNSRAALEELNAVLEQSPDDAEALFWRAQVHVRMGQDDAAREDIRRAVALNIDLLEAYTLHDYLLARQRRWEEIIAAWTQYLERHPDDAVALLERAGTYKHHGNMERAFADLRRSCQLGNPQACKYLQRAKGG